MGVVDAECDHGVVSHGRSGTAPGAANEATDGALGLGILVAHMAQVLQRATLDAAIQPNSASESQLREMVQTLQNWALLAA